MESFCANPRDFVRWSNGQRCRGRSQMKSNHTGGGGGVDRTVFLYFASIRVDLSALSQSADGSFLVFLRTAAIIIRVVCINSLTEIRELSYYA